MKKIITILSAFLMILSISACAAPSESLLPSASPSASATTDPTTTPSNDPTPTPSTEPTPLPTPTPIPVSESVRALGDYTIIYPADYENPRQMTEVELLSQVIEKLSGKKPTVVSDAAASITGKNHIIFASSSYNTEFDSKIDALTSEMDYIICVDKDKNIVLGGQTYYSDMRAAYDFINNYLGYNDIDDIYSIPEKDITGEFVYTYEAPTFIIAAHNAAHNVFTKAVIRDAKEAHFNLMTADKNFCTDEEYMDIATWCVRFEMYFMAHVSANYETCDVTLTCEDFMLKNPMVKHAHLRDEPGEDLLPTIHKMAKNFNSKYAQYGLKCYVNHFRSGSIFEAMENTGYLSNVPVTGYDAYLRNYSTTSIGGSIHSYLSFLQLVKRVTDKYDQEFWMYLESYDLANKKVINGSSDSVKVYTSKTFRYTAYLSMCFGADAVNYFCYADTTYYKAEGDWSHGQLLEEDFTPTQAWYDAKATNEELEKLSKVYSQYTNKAAYVIGPDEENEFTPIDACTPYYNIIEEFLDKKGNEITDKNYLVGCFDKNEGDGHAFIIMNLEELNAQQYSPEKGSKIKLKINGENVTFYQGGEKIDVAVDADGYYTPVMANGACIFVTVD